MSYYILSTHTLTLIFYYLQENYGALEDGYAHISVQICSPPFPQYNVEMFFRRCRC